MNYTQTVPLNLGIAIAFPVIIGVVIITITLLVGVVFYVCRLRRRSENTLKLQEEIYHDSLESDPNVRRQSSASYHQADPSNSSSRIIVSISRIVAAVA